MIVRYTQEDAIYKEEINSGVWVLLAIKFLNSYGEIEKVKNICDDILNFMKNIEIDRERYIFLM